MYGLRLIGQGGDSTAFPSREQLKDAQSRVNAMAAADGHGDNAMKVSLRADQQDHDKIKRTLDS